MVLNMLKDVGDIAANVPYVHAIAGILSTIIDIHQQSHDCKEEWKATIQCIENIKAEVDVFLAEQKQNGEIPAHVRKAFDALVASIQVTFSSRDKYQALSRMERLWKRRELKDEAKKCVELISGAETRLHRTLLGPMAIQVDQIYNIVQSQHILSTSVPSQVPTFPTEDQDGEFLKKVEEYDLYMGCEAELSAGSGGDERDDGIGGSGGGIAVNNSHSKLGFHSKTHISAGNGGEGWDIGEGGHGGAIGADNVHSMQRYWGLLNAGDGGNGDSGGNGGTGGDIGVENVETTQDFRGSIVAGCGGTSNLGAGGAGGSIGIQNRDAIQYFNGKIKSGRGGNATGKFGRGGNGGSIGSGNY